MEVAIPGWPRLLSHLILDKLCSSCMHSFFLFHILITVCLSIGFKYPELEQYVEAPIKQTQLTPLVSLQYSTNECVSSILFVSTIMLTLSQYWHSKSKHDLAKYSCYLLIEHEDPSSHHHVRLFLIHQFTTVSYKTVRLLLAEL